jgi:tetratricopeptide (TPR) repeat protein
MLLRIALSIGCVLMVTALARGDAPAAAAPQTEEAKSLFEAGRKLAAANDHAGALEKYAASLAADPSRAEVHAYKAASHLALGQPDEAQREVDMALKLDAKDFRFWEISGQIRIGRGEIKEGSALYAKAAELSPRDAGAIYTDLAAALANRNDTALNAQIESALKTAAAADPPGADALFQLGQTYANAGRQEGKAYLQRYLKAAADLPEAQRDAQKIQVAKQMIRALDILRNGP